MGKTESHFRWQGAAPGDRCRDVSIQPSMQSSVQSSTQSFVIRHLSSVIDPAIDLFQVAGGSPGWQVAGVICCPSGNT